jgi:hypothetical protein
MQERALVVCASLLIAILLPLVAKAQESAAQQKFRIKYVAQDAVYLEGGSANGLKEGQKLIVEHTVAPAIVESRLPNPPAPPSGIVASLQVLSVTPSSAVCAIVSSGESLQVGDFARMSPEVAQKEVQEQQQMRLVGGREYPVIVTFTGADPLVEEARAAVPRPPTPDVNRMKGRIGFEYDSIITHGTPSSTSSELGMVARFDMTRLGGTHWNFDGYWRGRFTTLSGSAAPVTISDLVNRTYTLNLEYNNPDSHWVAGGGRLYLPWATSLDVIDGGYMGRKISDRATLGVFGGTTPDPTSYDYNPNGKLAGVFLNFQGGSFETTRYSSTFGLALAAINWHASRQFAFEETSISWNRKLSLFNSMEIDVPHTVVVTPSGSTTTPPATTTTSTGGLNRSYLSLRYQVHPRVELELNDTYYRDFPSFDPALIGTGLLDQYLFQGLSGGVRVSLPAKIMVYTDIGKSSASGDTNGSWNQLYGLTFGEIWKTGLRADLRYSKFNSSFGSGDYKAISLSRPLGDKLQWQFLGGIQHFNSTLTSTTQSHFLNTVLDWSPGRVVFFEAGYTWQRGGTMNYDQFQFLVGKRF